MTDKPKGFIEIILPILLPIIMERLPDLLKSLSRKDAAAAKAGYAGPMTAFYDAQEAGQTEGEALYAACSAYCRCCEDLKKAGQPV